MFLCLSRMSSRKISGTVMAAARVLGTVLLRRKAPPVTCFRNCIHKRGWGGEKVLFNNVIMAETWNTSTIKFSLFTRTNGVMYWGKSKVRLAGSKAYTRMQPLVTTLVLPSPCKHMDMVLVRGCWNIWAALCDGRAAPHAPQNSMELHASPVSAHARKQV